MYGYIKMSKGIRSARKTSAFDHVQASIHFRVVLCVFVVSVPKLQKLEPRSNTKQH